MRLSNILKKRSLRDHVGNYRSRRRLELELLTIFLKELQFSFVCIPSQSFRKQCQDFMIRLLWSKVSYSEILVFCTHLVFHNFEGHLLHVNWRWYGIYQDSKNPKLKKLGGASSQHRSSTCIAYLTSTKVEMLNYSEQGRNKNDWFLNPVYKQQRNWSIQQSSIPLHASTACSPLRVMGLCCSCSPSTQVSSSYSLKTSVFHVATQTLLLTPLST
jgi:hypothetical protein